MRNLRQRKIRPHSTGVKLYQYEYNTRNAFAKEATMAEEVRQVEHYSASIPNKVGEGAHVLRTLRDAGVNLIAFWGYQYRAAAANSNSFPKTALRLSPPQSKLSSS